MRDEICLSIGRHCLENKSQPSFPWCVERESTFQDIWMPACRQAGPITTSGMTETRSRRRQQKNLVAGENSGQQKNFCIKGGNHGEYKRMES
jgi:hypothetical protein